MREKDRGREQTKRVCKRRKKKNKNRIQKKKPQ